MIRTFLIVLLMSFFADNCAAQLTDLARVEYTHFPQTDSDNSFRRVRAFVNAPIKLDEDSYLVPGFEYRNVNFQFEDDTQFIKRDLDRFESFNLSLGYTTKISEEWRIGAVISGLAASNFTGKLDGDDILFTGAVYFIKDKTGEGEATKPWRLILGGRYDTESGRPFPLPFVNYYREFHPDWSFTLGAPKSNLKRYFGTRRQHIMQGFVTLDGFFANIQDDVRTEITENGAVRAENISMTIVLSGIGYEYQFTKHLVFYAYAGYTLLNDIRLRDEDREDVFTINDTNSFYARSGIKFKI